MPNQTTNQRRAAMVVLSMSPLEHEMSHALEVTLINANSAGDPHHWDRSTYGAVKSALVALAVAVIDRCNRNTPPDAARALARRVVDGMIENHENMPENFRLVAEGIR